MRTIKFFFYSSLTSILSSKTSTSRAVQQMLKTKTNFFKPPDFQNLWYPKWCVMQAYYGKNIQNSERSSEELFAANETE